MPATSEKQRVAAAIALSAKRGDTPKSKLKGASKQMAKGMDETQLGHFAKKSACRDMLDTFTKVAGPKPPVRGFRLPKVPLKIAIPSGAAALYGAGKLLGGGSQASAGTPPPPVPAPEAAAPVEGAPEAPAVTPPPPPKPPQGWMDWLSDTLMGPAQSRADVELKQTQQRQAAGRGQ